MNLAKIVAEECCFHLSGNSKTEVLIEMMECLYEKGYVLDLDSLKKEIFYREQLMSTGIGVGIGIPHVRFKGIEKPVIAVGIRKGGISDYESIDKEEVKIVIMILVGEHQHKEHIRILSLAMDKLKDSVNREKLVNAADGKAIYDLLTGESSHE